jgi:hypothetical protein
VPSNQQGSGPTLIGRSLPGAIQDEDLVLEEKRLRNEGTEPAGAEQPSQDGDEIDERNGQIAHQRIVAGRRILRSLGRNNNSSAKARPLLPFLEHSVADFLKFRVLFHVGAQFRSCGCNPGVNAFEYLADAGRGGSQARLT